MASTRYSLRSAAWGRTARRAVRAFPLWLVAMLFCPAALAGDGLAFRAECAATARASEGQSVISGEDGWLFLTAEIRHLGVEQFWGEHAIEVSRAAKPEWADPLPTILDFKNQLDRLGIDLLVVPVPAKAAIHANQFSASASVGERADSQDRAFYDLLAERGVSVLDLAPHFLAAKQDQANAGAPYCKTDTHWSPRGCRIAAQRIAAACRERPWFASIAKTDFDTEETEIEIVGDLSRMDGAEERKETLRARRVTVAGKPESVESDRDSPILLLGDSHCLVFNAGGDMHARGMGLADQLAAEMGVAPDLLAVRGSGVTTARIDLLRRTRKDAAYLPGKKIVIWCFAARDFTESRGWRKVPIVP